MDMYGFYTGKIFNAYEYLGCHLITDGSVFRTFAPAATKISVVGDFNNWSETPMDKIYDNNFWECTIKGAKEGMRYKYRIYKADGTYLDHCDPYGFGAELRPQTASIIRDLSAYRFTDGKWMKSRSDCKDKPLNIYEIHLGSWRKNPANENGWYTYSELADILIPYLKEYGYNYVEMLPISEHPCDESWGYQNTGFYSPTSRYGTADELKEMINKCHKNGIGVILDFVPVHFAVDDYALANYDGKPLYEYPHADVGNSEWGSKNFNHSRGEVRSFLQSNANYWLQEFHFDGLRIDAISNIIYWQGDAARGVNKNAVEFIAHMNQGLKKLNQGIILTAEDSSAFPNVTKPVSEKGLGFDYKWDMGWMNDTLAYMQTSPNDRLDKYHKLTFSMMYYWNENFLMPLSHDEVVHGKATIVQKMSGSYEEKFPQARVLYMYMYSHPGKKLNFMGNENGQLREWDEKKELDWGLLTYPKHDSFHRFMKELNRIYIEHPAFYEKDYERDGFEWIDCTNKEDGAYAFLRKAKEQWILAVFNFSDEAVPEYEIQIPKTEKATLLLDSNWECFGGKKKKVREETLIAESGMHIQMEKFSAKYYIIKKKREESVK